MSNVTVKFWGVRGSVPSPLLPSQVEEKIEEALKKSVEFPISARTDVRAWMAQHLTFAERSTFGGNTTCVEVRCDDHLLIFDMGTGIRELGNSLIPETIKNKGVSGTIFQSHVHWDHIQGYPFWPQLYMSRKQFDNYFKFFGGKDWDKSLDDALRGQMNPPMFPIDHRELERTGLRMDFETIWDGREIDLPGGIRILCRKLNHPQETYGYRVEYHGKVVTFCTDHEPYAALHQPLVELAKGADLFITDCQYTYHEYAGAKGVPKLGWGHSFPEYIAQVAQTAKCKQIATTHHDPGAHDAHVIHIAQSVEQLSGTPACAAYEGLVLNV